MDGDRDEIDIQGKRWDRQISEEEIEMRQIYRERVKETKRDRDENKERERKRWRDRKRERCEVGEKGGKQRAGETDRKSHVVMVFIKGSSLQASGDYNGD